MYLAPTLPDLIRAFAICSLYVHVLAAQQAFPAWLQSLTGETSWPAGDPPYIPQAHLRLDKVPVVAQRTEGQCAGVSDADCSFDCRVCVRADDVASCPRLSQSFDDGPSPATLTLLRKLKGKTTFFTLGAAVVTYPQIFRQQHARGHLLGTHTWNHRRLTELSNEEIAAQLQWSIWAMNATAGVIPRFFRPPYGAVDERVREIAGQFGLTTVLWDRDSEDWRLAAGTLTHGEIEAAVRRWSRGRPPQGLILEHDTTPETVKLALAIDRRLRRQRTVAGCAGVDDWYQ